MGMRRGREAGCYLQPQEAGCEAAPSACDRRKDGHLPHLPPHETVLFPWRTCRVLYALTSTAHPTSTLAHALQHPRHSQALPPRYGLFYHAYAARWARRANAVLYGQTGGGRHGAALSAHPALDDIHYSRAVRSSRRTGTVELV